MKNLTIYCAPKNYRPDQYNCAFFASSSGDKIYVTQFDIKGDKDKKYEFSLSDFEKYWEVLSYVKRSSLISTQDLSNKPVSKNNIIDYNKDMEYELIKDHDIRYFGKPITFYKK